MLTTLERERMRRDVAEDRNVFNPADVTWLLDVAEAAYEVFYGPQKGHLAGRNWKRLEEALNRDRDQR